SEKNGMSPILGDVTDHYGVSLYPTGGYSSVTFLKDAAHELNIAGKPAIVLQVGDRDHSGLDAARAAEARLRCMVEVPLEFRRIAVLPEHIEEFDLPTRPQKADKRSGVEQLEAEVVLSVLDAIPNFFERDGWVLIGLALKACCGPPPALSDNDG